ncbi:MAG: choice-of-anchor Q domain-containing protein [Cyanobacteriota bacterium]
MSSAVLDAVHGALYSFAIEGRLRDGFASVFGEGYQRRPALLLEQQWLRHDFGQLPVIHLVSAEEMGLAIAAYSSRTNQIYLSQSVVERFAPTALVRTILEEVGHFVDVRIKTNDTPGDEGELFAATVLGRPLTAAERQRVFVEDDHLRLLLHGAILNVEKADPLVLTVSTTLDESDGSGTVGAGLSLRDAILTANNNPAVDYEIRLTGGHTYSLRASGFHEDNGLKGDLDIKPRTGALVLVAIGEPKARIDASKLALGDRVFDVLANGNLTLDHLIISGGNPGGDGGGLRVGSGAVLVAHDVEIHSNRAIDGGGIANSGSCRLTQVNISNNRASAGSGDGIYNGNSANLLLVDSSVSQNSGVGIYSFGEILLVNSLVGNNASKGIYLNKSSAGLVNTTISGNGDTGIDAVNGSSLMLANCTVTRNQCSAVLREAAGIQNANSSVFLRNTIVAANSNDDGGIAELKGWFDGDNNNLIGSLEDAFGSVGTGTDIVDPNPGLTDLQDNGGPILTHALIDGSPAINAGDNALVILDDEDLDVDGNRLEAIPFDGRGAGFERIRSGIVDIGAVEATTPDDGPVISLELSPPSLAEDGANAFVFTFTRTGSTERALTVEYSLSGTATAGSDYVIPMAGPTPNTVTIAAGAEAATVPIQPRADSKYQQAG